MKIQNFNTPSEKIEERRRENWEIWRIYILVHFPAINETYVLFHCWLNTKPSNKGYKMMSSWNSTLKFNPLWLRIGNSKYLKEEKKTSKKIRRLTHKFRCFFCLSSIIYFNICTLWLLQQIQICKLLLKSTLVGR